MPLISALNPADVFIFWLIFFAVLLGLGWFSWFGWRMTNKIDVSPYTGLPLRFGRDIGYYQSEKIYSFLFEIKQYDNRMFDLAKASFCRDTGRIFANSVTWLGSIRVNWNFLQDRLKGQYVSWGSLTREQQQEIIRRHDSLDGFQTDISSPTPIPKHIEPQFAYTKPGPLYVEVTSGTLLGWKSVPGTDFEVLIVQKPTKVTYQKTT